MLTSLQGTNAAAEGGKEVLLAISRELRASPEEYAATVAADRCFARRSSVSHRCGSGAGDARRRSGRKYQSHGDAKKKGDLEGATPGATSHADRKVRRGSRLGVRRNRSPTSADKPSSHQQRDAKEHESCRRRFRSDANNLGTSTIQDSAAWTIERGVNGDNSSSVRHV